uniref:Uncharacterized protein n=1 Tax=Amphimedon queenslandica TaxID=400682 RepID=A0A1X7V7Z1_AMPQE
MYYKHTGALFENSNVQGTSRQTSLILHYRSQRASMHKRIKR